MQTLPPVLEPFRAQLDQLFEACRHTCAVILKAFGHALGVRLEQIHSSAHKYSLQCEEEYFSSKHHVGTTFLLHYAVLVSLNNLFTRQVTIAFVSYIILQHR